MIFIKKVISKEICYLVTVCETTHTTHDTKDVVVDGVDVKSIRTAR